MSTSNCRRFGLASIVLLACLPAVFGTFRQEPGFKTEHFNGKVVPLTDWLDKQGAKLDPDVADSEMVLVGDDGKVYTLVKDTGSRMFFLDKGLRNRPMRLTARLILI